MLNKYHFYLKHVSRMDTEQILWFSRRFLDLIIFRQVFSPHFPWKKKQKNRNKNGSEVCVVAFGMTCRNPWFTRISIRSLARERGLSKVRNSGSNSLFVASTWHEKNWNFPKNLCLKY